MIHVFDMSKFYFILKKEDETNEKNDDDEGGRKGEIKWRRPKLKVGGHFLQISIIEWSYKVIYIFILLYGV